MRTYRFFQTAAVLLTGVLATAFATDAAAETLSLRKPALVSQTEASAFPADEAGISAYAKVDQAIDIEEVKPIFSEVEDVGDTITSSA